MRSDGTRILVSERLSYKAEFAMIKTTLFSKVIVLSALWAIWSFFYGGTWVSPVAMCHDTMLTSQGTYLATYFSVRARALSSLISPFFCMYVTELYV